MSGRERSADDDGREADVPAALAVRPLYEPLSPWLSRFDNPGVPALASLESLVAAAGRPCSGGGRPLMFAAPADDGLTYERRVHDLGVVATRPGDWHDFFNALAWLAFPHTKAALNTRHCAEMASRAAAGLAGRGLARDAATQFDECGIAVVASDPALLQLLAERRWRSLFWERRTAHRQALRFVVVGHGLYDQLRRPFFGLCGKAALIEADEGLLVGPLATLHDHVDRRLAARFADPRCYCRPREFPPVPLLGIPGLTPDNASATYYDDVRQFRPAPGQVPAEGRMAPGSPPGSRCASSGA